jgi:transposase
MVPVRPGGHIKTDRRDATILAALFRAGELTAIRVPDAAHAVALLRRSCVSRGGGC